MFFKSENHLKFTTKKSSPKFEPCALRFHYSCFTTTPLGLHMNMKKIYEKIYNNNIRHGVLVY